MGNLGSGRAEGEVFPIAAAVIVRGSWTVVSPFSSHKRGDCREKKKAVVVVVVNGVSFMSFFSLDVVVLDLCAVVCCPQTLGIRRLDTADSAPLFKPRPYTTR